MSQNLADPTHHGSGEEAKLHLPTLPKNVVLPAPPHQQEQSPKATGKYWNPDTNKYQDNWCAKCKLVIDSD